MNDLWTTLDVDLGEPFRSFDLAGERSCLVNLRYHGAVIGQFAATPADLPRTRVEFGEMAARAAGPAAVWLADLGQNDLTIPELAVRTGRTPRWCSEDELFPRLGRAIASRRSRPVTVSASIVIIATGRKPSALRRILAAIEPDLRAGHEAIVIHDGCDADVGAVLEGRTGIRPVIGRDRPAGAAYHAALRHACGDVAVFLDDGLVPEPGWLRPLLQGFDESWVGAVLGMVLPAASERAEVIHAHFDRYHSYVRSLPMRFGPEFLSDWRWGVPVWETGGRSVRAVRRKAALTCRRSVGSGPSEIWKALLGAGWTLRYEPLSLTRRSHASAGGAAVSSGSGSLFRHMLAYRRRGTRYELPHVDLLPPWQPLETGLGKLFRRAS